MAEAKTGAERNKAYRERQAAKLKRYEEALREIATGYYGLTSHIIAESALAKSGGE